MQIYIDGNWVGKEDAKISVFDHGLLYGDGVFEGIRIYNGTIFRLKEHVRRLYDSARATLLTIPMSEEEMAELLLEAVAKNEKTDGYIRLVITRGVGDLGINPATCPEASVIVIVDDISLYPEEHYTRGIKVITASTRRNSPDAVDPRIKSLNYLNNIMAKLEAQQAGCLEAILLNREGKVAECTGDNIFYIRDGVLLTPASDQGALKGITRDAVIEAAEGIGMETRATPSTLYDLYTADECFLTGTAAEMIPVTTIDGRTIGTGTPGPDTARVREAFQALIKNEEQTAAKK
ncbi:branched-chain-amino-acid transaminase [Desulfoluna butyratoxydans]|uniref:Branched-chain-amino-acid aminotransferase n=1 Tax=Desulfoluna butyratoxydans TaxID=231438 RepID=A0A4U8YST3_9BACT|nr:branched-chain-amino-acid transaminase [Desulfoluna butyratoxydans]VFQ47020.1 branched-chain amino acid aminotransferase i [Desulfoluna butyratoxydans]